MAFDLGGIPFTILPTSSYLYSTSIISVIYRQRFWIKSREDVNIYYQPLPLIISKHMKVASHTQANS